MTVIPRPPFRTTTASVDFTRKEIVALRRQYDLIRDCIAGEFQIKSKREKYLPRPNPSDKSIENNDRYQSYLDRAVFYNVTKRTHEGLIGQIFLRDPVVEIPTKLDVLKADATGSGVSLEQLAKQCAGMTLAFGRGGILADYPNVAQTTEDGIDGAITVAQLETGDIRPMIYAYDPWDVINWRTVVRGSRELLSLVVIRELFGIHDDGFEVKEETQYRVLRLVNGNLYTVEFWRRMNNGGFSLHEGPYAPRDAAGNTFTEIPFKFIGCNDNDTTVDHPPLYDLAALNIAHYRNSADYEESCYIVGQPTPYFAGLTESWVKEVLKGKIQLGARDAVPLPEGGSAGLLQADPNTMPKEAMDAKERQMVALGAKLVEQKTIQRTATEADLENSSETSVLSACTKNVSDAITWALQQTARYTGDDPTGISFKLNTEFDLTQMSFQERAELVKEWQSGAITFGEMRASLRRAGVATVDDKEAQATIQTEMATMPGLMPVAAPGTGNNPPDSDKDGN